MRITSQTYKQNQKRSLTGKNIIIKQVKEHMMCKYPNETQKDILQEFCTHILRKMQNEMY